MILVANDLHLADRPPANRREGYREEGLALLAEVVEIANERGAEAIVFTGDVFHLKAPHRTSHALVAQVLNIMQQSRCPVYVVPGNHDMAEEGLASLPRQPLGVLVQAGAVRLLVGPARLASGTLLVGRPYNMHRDADPHYYALQEDEQAEVVYVFAHGSIVPDHETRPYPIVRVNQIDLSGIAVLASGHIHEDLGTHKYGKTWFTNVGSLGRVARNESNLTRTLKVVAIHSPELLEEIPLTAALPADTIFLEDTISVAEGDDAIAEFVNSLHAGFQFEAVDLLQLAQQAPIQVREHLLKYLEKAGA